MLRFLPYFLGGGIAIAAYWFIYNAGYSNGEQAQIVECEKRVAQINQAHADALKANESAQKSREQQAVERARKYWEANQKQEVVTQTIEKEVIKYVEREANNDSACELDADFLRIWNAANEGSIENKPDQG